MIVAEAAFAAVCHEIERRILFVAQSARPEVAPFAQEIIDSRLDAVSMNSNCRTWQDVFLLFGFVENLYLQIFRPTVN